jgi:hypothetical protein
VPDSLHIHAYPFISALNIPDFVNHESPANGPIKDRRLPDDLANCHAEGRGFESHQPLRFDSPALRQVGLPGGKSNHPRISPPFWALLGRFIVTPCRVQWLAFIGMLALLAVLAAGCGSSSSATTSTRSIPEDEAQIESAEGNLVGHCFAGGFEGKVAHAQIAELQTIIRITKANPDEKFKEGFTPSKIAQQTVNDLRECDPEGARMLEAALLGAQE